MKHLFLLAFMMGASLSVSAQDAWKMEATHIDDAHYYGETVANGMLGLVSSYQPLQTSCVVLAGCYDKFGRGDVSNFLHGFNMLNTTLEINGEAVNYKNVSNYTQTLDMRHAVFSGDFNFRNVAEVNYQFVSLRQLQYCGLLIVKIVPKQDITIRATNMQQLPEGFKNGKYKYEEMGASHAKAKLLSTESDSPTGYRHVCACSTFLFPNNENTDVKDDSVANGHEISFKRTLKKGQEYEFVVAGSTMSNATFSDPINEVKRLVLYCLLEGKDKLMAKHFSAWDELWKSDIIIDGDAQAQQDVHGMMYHLYAFLREGSGLSISPMGLSGLGYNGHVFWDMETWMYPALLLLHPELAKSALDYRYDRLEAAKRNAAEYGYAGAKFPWESSDSGAEDTPVWAMTGPFEHSITGCVGFAAWQYYCVTGDRDWLQKRGYPLLKESADFWLSRVDRSADGVCHINNVVAADEWAENIDDDAFTNGIAKMNLLCAAKAARLLGEPVNKDWESVADKIPFYTDKDGVTKEYQTYKGDNIKQADVNLLAFPLKFITDEAQVKKDLGFYQKRVPVKGTPAMTQAIFSLLWSRLGDVDQASHYFKDSYEPNLLPPFRVIAETKGGTNPYFATGAGGILQCVMMGFGGIDISYDGGITQVKSVLPKGWKKLTLKGIGKDKQTFVRE
jgi:protein-glucosylgalactosylhydroxylysine glucosidase